MRRSAIRLSWAALLVTGSRSRRPGSRHRHQPLRHRRSFHPLVSISRPAIAPRCTWGSPNPRQKLPLLAAERCRSGLFRRSLEAEAAIAAV